MHFFPSQREMDHEVNAFTDPSVLFADAPRATSSCRRDPSEGGIHKSEIQHPDAVFHFTHVSEDSTKLTKADTSSESTPSVILK
jgi:hypothetical protein